MHYLSTIFCLPPHSEITDFDAKSLAKAVRSIMPFEGMRLPLYAWGQGKNVLLVHGWGSRASHMGLLARMLAVRFHVFAFDAPAHSSNSEGPDTLTSNLFEYGRAISAVARHVGNLHAVVGHSFGGTAALFASTGYLKFAGHGFAADKFVLMSSPSSVQEIVLKFLQNCTLTDAEKDQLPGVLEQDFDFSIADYDAGLLKDVNGNVLIVHDENDEEVPVSNANVIQKALPQAALHLTQGLGHARILFDRKTVKVVAGFLDGEVV